MADVFRQSDGTLSSRRGFTSRTTAATARRRLQESVDRGEVKVSREDFATFWTPIGSGDRRAYMTSGSHLDLVTHGRKRLLPFFGADTLAKIDEDRVREWLASMIELVEAGDLAPKTVNNARTCLSVAFNEASARRHHASQPRARTLPARGRSASRDRVPATSGNLALSVSCVSRIGGRLTSSASPSSSRTIAMPATTAAPASHVTRYRAVRHVRIHPRVPRTAAPLVAGHRLRTDERRATGVPTGHA